MIWNYIAALLMLLVVADNVRRGDALLAALGAAALSLMVASMLVRWRR